VLLKSTAPGYPVPASTTGARRRISWAAAAATNEIATRGTASFGRLPMPPPRVVLGLGVRLGVQVRQPARVSSIVDVVRLLATIPLARIRRLDLGRGPWGLGRRFPAPCLLHEGGTAASRPPAAGAGFMRRGSQLTTRRLPVFVLVAEKLASVSGAAASASELRRGSSGRLTESRI